jgi:hypothetical protein
MTNPNISDLRPLLQRSVGPAPWYWKTFPAFISVAGQKFTWTHHGDQGPLGYLVSLALQQEPDKPRLALNTYCRPFLVQPSLLGVWCPEGRSIRVMCFDPDQLKAFDFVEIAGWFKASADRIYAATAPIAEFEVPTQLPLGIHKIDVPTELQTVAEMIVPTSYKAEGINDPAFALYVVYPQAGLVEVLPQQWFTAAQYEVGKQWITRATRDPESHRIIGECFGAGSFVLQEDGRRLDSWIEKLEGN